MICVFKVYNSVIFLVYGKNCANITTIIFRIIYRSFTPLGNPVPFSHHVLIPLSLLAPREPLIYLLSLSLYLPILGISYKCGLLCLASFTLHNDLQVYPAACVSTSLLFMAE